MALADQFVVRDLKQATGNILADAFRAHLPPESLERLGLRIGDVCELVSEDDGTIGYAVAWRAADKLGSPKNPPIKLTETLREAFGFKLGAQIAVRNTRLTLRKARGIILTELTKNGETAAVDDESWVTRCKFALLTQAGNCEAIATNVSFDIASRARGPKKRFFVEKIVAATADNSGGLFTVDDSTDVVIQEEPLLPTTPSTSKLEISRTVTLRIQTDTIGGLRDQLKILNRRLRALLEAPAYPNNGILLHGYGGTGKSMVLDELSHLPFVKVLRLDTSTLSGIGVKSHNTINDTFAAAKADQPSIVLMDALDETFPTDSTLATTLVRNLSSLAGSQVLVVGAARKPTDVHPLVTGPGAIDQSIELPIPNAIARSQILRAFTHGGLGNLCDEFGAVTHGFTGRDLNALWTTARCNAVDRYWSASEEEWVNVASDQIDGGTESTPSKDHSANHLDPMVVSKPTRHDFELAMKVTRPTALREVILEPPRITWSDIGGSESMKSRFDRIIGWPLRFPEILACIPDRQPTKGVLLYGPPGCSKTMTAQAVASTYGLNFLAIKGAELISQYVGESERAIREIFRKAKAAAPCVIFFDEIDAIASARSSSGSSASGLNILTTLLNEMDGFETLKNVYVLAATNKPDVLDSALMRPGRLDQHVYVGLPMPEARLDIMRICLRRTPLHEDVDFEVLKEVTEGYSGADIVSVCSRVAVDAAIERAIKSGSKVEVTQQDLLDAVKQVPRSVTDDMLGEYAEFQRRAAR